MPFYNNFIILIMLLSGFLGFSQTPIEGTIMDSDKQPIFGANIYLKSLPNKGTSTDEKGFFTLMVDDPNDTLIVSFINFKTKQISLLNLTGREKQIIILEEDHQVLDEIIIVGKDPISEKFSVNKISKLDIYFNPVSKGDPLNSVQILPASTNTDETANPTLRGGSPDRSRVYINGAPVLSPVRNTQSNGLGNFSLFNTEIIGTQYVYAGNPPLTYGNSSSGIVDIETAKELDSESLQIYLALSSVGIMLNKNIGKKSFFQCYGNHQFPDLLIGLNKGHLPNIKDFGSQDFGLNFRTELSKNISFNSYNYFINEKYSVRNYFLNFDDFVQAGQKRFFTINSIDYNKNRSKISTSVLFDRSNKDFQFGIINSDSEYHNLYASLNYKYKFTHNFTTQYGINYYDANYHYYERKPRYYFAIDKNSPFLNNNENVKFNYLEIYVYNDYKINHKLGVSGALRKNIFPNKNIHSFLSYQLSGYYNLNTKNRFIVGVGNYNSYSTPNYFVHNISLLNSKQASLDYYYTSRKYNFTGAFYYKVDKGNINPNHFENFDKIITLGFEASLRYDIDKYFSLGVSNIFLKQKGYINNSQYNTQNNLKYYIKSQFTYTSPKYLTASLSLTTRPGNNYTDISNSVYEKELNQYRPTYRNLNDKTYDSYFKLDFTANKIFKVFGNPLIAYVSVTNVLNNNNQSSVYYNKDYSNSYYNHYQQRIIYFGVQYRINTIF